MPGRHHHERKYYPQPWMAQPAPPKPVERVVPPRKPVGPKKVCDVCVELAVDPAKCLSFRTIAKELAAAAALATDDHIYAQRMRHPFLQVDLTRRIDSFGLAEFGTSRNRNVSQATATRLFGLETERQLISLSNTKHRNNQKLAMERALFLHNYNNRKKKFYESE